MRQPVRKAIRRCAFGGSGRCSRTAAYDSRLGHRERSCWSSSCGTSLAGNSMTRPTLWKSRLGWPANSCDKSPTRSITDSSRSSFRSSIAAGDRSALPPPVWLRLETLVDHLNARDNSYQRSHSGSSGGRSNQRAAECPSSANTAGKAMTNGNPKSVTSPSSPVTRPGAKIEFTERRLPYRVSPSFLEKFLQERLAPVESGGTS